MIEIFPVTGCPGAECFLLVSEDGAFLADTGYAFCAETTAQNIARVLNERPLDGILLTHSHYDHIGGLPTMKRFWPGAKVVAHRHTQEVFARPGARRVMHSLDSDAAAKRGEAAVREDYFEALAADMLVKEGDLLRMGGATIRVMETPGHTNCSVSYHFREEDLLVLCETVGVRLRGGEIIPTFIVSCEAAMRTIARVEALAPRRILIAHSNSGVTEGPDVRRFLQDARAAARVAADMILTAHKQGKDFEEILAEYTEKFYIGTCRLYQPPDAFQRNTRAMIPRLIAEAESAARERPEK
jgi:glyoxylase-like metal-dependent hydrolase (beta-lactamase superfamily II)